MQWLLRALVHHFLPELALMADAIQLTFNVLLGYLQQAQDGVVSLLSKQVQDATVFLRGNLAPSFVNTAHEVLCTILPVEQFHIHIQFFLSAIIHSRSREYTNDLTELHGATCKLGDVVLQSLEVLLIDLLIKLLVDAVHVLLVPLVVLCPLTPELAQVVTVFANVHIMSRALHCQVVHLVTELSNVALGFAAGALQSRSKALRRLAFSLERLE